MFLKRRQPDDSWARAEPEPGGYVAFIEEDYVALEIRNNYSAPIYFTLLNFASEVATSQLYPQPGAKEMLASNRSIQKGSAPPDDGIQLFLPEKVPPPPAGALETYKLIVTLQEADFS